ncbi:MAG: hypothetical protein R3301_08530 [Saprospiraceae bacterium]|nr:hypothetical protein [Saprospiraceae bacterium]
MNAVVSDMEAINTFASESRVWVYQGHKAVPADKRDAVRRVVADFATRWTSHNHQLKAYGDLLYDRFLVLVADETQAGASGCSIDTSVRFVQQLGEQLAIDFMDRLHFTYLDSDGAVHSVHKDHLPTAYQNGEVTDTTLMFDNLVRTKGDFTQRWLVPLGESWMKRFV